MKPIETNFLRGKKHAFVMWAAFLYGGFAILLFGMDLYSAVWMGSSTFITAPEIRNFDQNRFVEFNDTNHQLDLNRPRAGPPFISNPLRIITSPISMLILLSGIISLACGFTIMSITRQKEIKKIKQETADYLLLPDEKKVIEALKRNNYSLAQSKIAIDSGLNKVQVHRVIKRLEMKGLIEKHDFGLTNKIVLKKELFE
ncbi:MAG: hypothetical protein WCW44_06325 [archaeon]|jgi:uncharacterized membrane protein